MRPITQILSVGILLASLLLVGCNSFNHFKVNESELNKALGKELSKAKENSIHLTVDGKALDLNLLLKTAHVDLMGHDGGKVLVNMTTDLTGTLNALGQSFSFTTQVNPTFESGVRLQDKNVYLVGPKLTQVDVEGNSFSDKMLRSTLGSLHNEFEKALVRYFDTHPVYVLDHSVFEKTSASMIKEIVVKDDALEFILF